MIKTQSVKSEIELSMAGGNRSVILYAIFRQKTWGLIESKIERGVYEYTGNAFWRNGGIIYFSKLQISR